MATEPAVLTPAPAPARSPARPALGRRLRGLVLPVLLLILWQVLGQAHALPDYLLTPATVVRQFGLMLWSGDLWPHIGASLLRAISGYVLGALGGVLLGLLAGVARPVETFFDPLVSLTYPVPKIALFPVLILWLGLGHESKIAIIMLACFYPVFINSYYGARAVQPLHVWAARNMGAGPWQVFWKVVAPSALPQIFTGLRVALALAFVLLFSSEMIGARSGLGYLIIFAEANLRFDMMYVSILTIGLLGFASDRLLVRVRRWALRGRLTEAEVGRG